MPSSADEMLEDYSPIMSLIHGGRRRLSRKEIKCDGYHNKNNTNTNNNNKKEITSTINIISTILLTTAKMTTEMTRTTITTTHERHPIPQVRFRLVDNNNIKNLLIN